MSRGNAGLFARLREISTLGADARARRHKDIRRWLRAEEVQRAQDAGEEVQPEAGEEVQPEAPYVAPSNTELKALPLPDGGAIPLTRRNRRMLGQRNRHVTPKSDGKATVVVDRKGRLSMSAKETPEERKRRRANGVGRPR